MNANRMENITAKLKAYCEQRGGQNKAAHSMSGVSSATISKILSRKWGTISDDMWRSIESQIGYDLTGWRTANTKAYQRMIFLLGEAQNESLVLAVTGYAGGGKTKAIKQFSQEHKNVYHLCCSEFWNRKMFTMQLGQAIGLDFGGSLGEMMSYITDFLLRADKPLIILDEADKLADPVLYFFISLYNQLEGYCGIILCATPFLQKRIERGLRLKKKGYEEIYSRIGRKFIKLPAINNEDIAKVCMANDITDSEVINNIIKGSENDLRRVKRAVWSHKKSQGL